MSNDEGKRFISASVKISEKETIDYNNVVLPREIAESIRQTLGHLVMPQKDIDNMLNDVVECQCRQKYGANVDCIRGDKEKNS